MIRLDYNTLISLLDSFDCDFDLEFHFVKDPEFDYDIPVFTLYGNAFDVEAP